MILFHLENSSGQGIAFWLTLEVKHVCHGSDPSPVLSGIEGFGDITTFCSGNDHGCAKITSLQTVAIKSAVADHSYSGFCFSAAFVYLP